MLAINPLLLIQNGIQVEKFVQNAGTRFNFPSEN
jgi:hypothetical protein